MRLRGGLSTICYNIEAIMRGCLLTVRLVPPSAGPGSQAGMSTNSLSLSPRCCSKWCSNRTLPDCARCGCEGVMAQRHFDAPIEPLPPRNRIEHSLEGSYLSTICYNIEANRTLPDCARCGCEGVMAQLARRSACRGVFTLWSRRWTVSTSTSNLCLKVSE
jgi:hypothetical protein